MNKDPLTLLDDTRFLTFAAAGLLSLQFYGNLYEENAAIKNVVDPTPGASIGAFAPGSPFYFYMPWVMIGVLCTALLLVRLRRHDFPKVRQDIWVAAGCLVITAAAKIFLVTSVNDIFRDPSVPTSEVISAGWLWLGVNGIATASTGVALVLLLRWRARVPALIAASEGMTTITANTRAPR